MNFDLIAEKVDGIPHTPPWKGKVLYDTIIARKYTDCLELGFACGVGSAYIAGALDENNNGRLTSVDIQSALAREPRADTLIESLGLTSRTNFVFHEISYIWFLMEALEKGLRYDFCFLDGAHSWDVDGFAFFLVERLLKPGGMIIFDDLDWTYAGSPTSRNKPLPEKIRQTPAVRKIYELLVKGHPSFSEVYENDDWAFAIKKAV